MAGLSPTALTLRDLQRDGWTAEVVERWNSFGRIRQDLWGIVDVIALKDGEQPLAVQATSDSNVAARVRKIREHPNTPIVAHFFAVQVWGWRKVNGRWTARKVVP